MGNNIKFVREEARHFPLRRDCVGYLRILSKTDFFKDQYKWIFTKVIIFKRFKKRELKLNLRQIIYMIYASTNLNIFFLYTSRM